VVRVGPNELAFADPALIKEIYSQGTPYMKAPMYATFRRTYPTLFDMIDRDQHSQRRKLLSHAHAKSSVDEAEPLIAEQIAKFVEWMRKMEGTVVNVQVWYRMLALDITGSLFMGEDFGALESGKEPAYLDDADHFLLLVGLRWQMPYLLPLFSWVPIPSWQRLVNSEFLFFDYGDKALARYIQRYGREPKRKDLLKKIILGDETVSPLTDAEIGEELSHLIFAGTDTTSGTLTFICWELTRQPGWQTSLRKELRAAKVGFSHGVPKYKDVANLEILNAVITEGLRVHGPVPSGLPRVVPKEGAKLGGHFVPGGVSSLPAPHAFTDHQIRPSCPCKATPPSETPSPFPLQRSLTHPAGFSPPVPSVMTRPSTWAASWESARLRCGRLGCPSPRARGAALASTLRRWSSSLFWRR
jgi:cytochrome P450